MTAPLTFTTEAWIVRTDYRGREREYCVEVEYRVTPGTPARVEVLNVKLDGRDFDVSDDEWNDCYNVACEAAPSALADWFGDRDDYEYEQAQARAAESHVPAGRAA